MRGRATGRAALLLSLVVLAGATAACGSGPAAAGDAPSFAAPPLSSTFSAGGGATWASLPMEAAGLTFYELFELATPDGRWALVTPPGVATSGGLVLAGRGRELEVAFVTSALLTFSPVAASDDDGKVWAPATLPEPVTAAPDALASQPDGELLALVSGAGGGVEAADGDLSAWRGLAAAGAIDGSAGGRACDVRSLTAIAAGPDGSTLVGASCGRLGSVGVLQRGAGGSWQLAGPELPAGSSHDLVDVLRLTAAGAGDTTLLGVAGATGDELVAAWLRDGSWTSSAALPVHTGEALVASGVTGDGGCYVLLARGSALSLALATPSAAGPVTWRSVASPPPGTAAAAFLAGGRVDVLVVDGSDVDVDQLNGGATRWELRQTIDVPVPTSSSS